jgi:hypothetical protein
MHWFLLLWAILQGGQIAVFPSDSLTTHGLFNTRAECEALGQKFAAPPSQAGGLGYNFICLDLEKQGK